MPFEDVLIIEDILISICRELAPKTTCMCREVCRDLRKAATADSLWGHKLEFAHVLLSSNEPISNVTAVNATAFQSFRNQTRLSWVVLNSHLQQDRVAQTRQFFAAASCRVLACFVGPFAVAVIIELFAGVNISQLQTTNNDWRGLLFQFVIYLLANALQPLFRRLAKLIITCACALLLRKKVKIRRSFLGVLGGSILSLVALVASIMVEVSKYGILRFSILNHSRRVRHEHAHNLLHCHTSDLR